MIQYIFNSLGFGISGFPNACSLCPEFILTPKERATDRLQRLGSRIGFPTRHHLRTWLHPFEWSPRPWSACDRYWWYWYAPTTININHQHINRSFWKNGYHLNHLGEDEDAQVVPRFLDFKLIDVTWCILMLVDVHWCYMMSIDVPWFYLVGVEWCEAMIVGGWCQFIYIYIYWCYISWCQLMLS